MFLSKRKNGYYYLHDKVNNISISTKTKIKSEAYQFLKNFNINEHKRQEYYLQDCIKLFLQYLIKKNVSKKHYELARIYLNQLLGITGNVKINSLKKIDVTNFIMNNFVTNPYSSQHKLKKLKTFFNYLVDMNIVKENILARYKIPKIPQAEIKHINEMEFMELVELETNIKLKLIYQFLFYSGLRAGELVNMKWNWIDIENKLLYVINDIDFTTKSKNNRVIPLNNKLLNILAECKKEISLTGYVFHKDNKKYEVCYISRNFKKLVRKKYGVDSSFHLHNLRSSFGSNLLQRGCNIEIVSKLLGHSSINITQKHYATLNLDNLKQAMNLF